MDVLTGLKVEVEVFRIKQRDGKIYFQRWTIRARVLQKMNKQTKRIYSELYTTKESIDSDI